jgi:hypothetical protein
LVYSKPFWKEELMIGFIDILRACSFFSILIFVILISVFVNPVSGEHNFLYPELYPYCENNMPQRGQLNDGLPPFNEYPPFDGYPGSNESYPYFPPDEELNYPAYTVPSKKATPVSLLSEDTLIPNGTEDYDLGIYTDKLKYVEGDIISISGYVIDEKGCHVEHKTVSIEVKDLNANRVIYNASTNTILGLFEDAGANAYNPGKYSISAWVNGDNDIYHNEYEVSSLFMTLPTYMAYIGIIFLAGLMFIIGKGVVISPDVTEILRFICITGIVFAPIAALALTDVQIGSTSPIGLVQRPPLDINGVPECSSPDPLQEESSDQVSPETPATVDAGEWVINV